MSDICNCVIVVFVMYFCMDFVQLIDVIGFDDVKVDSFDLIEIVMLFEDVFGVEIMDDEWVVVRNVGEVVVFVESKVGVVV